jgi:hypothetical protein
MLNKSQEGIASLVTTIKVLLKLIKTLEKLSQFLAGLVLESSFYSIFFTIEYFVVGI